MIAELDGQSKSGEEPSPRLQRAPYRTPWGTGAVILEGCRLVSVELPALTSAPASPAVADSVHGADVSCAERWVASLEAYFSGQRLGWTSAEVPLEELDAGEFERAVYGALLTVPPAVTVSYGTLADMAGYPRAARAVGNAMASNPWPIVIPCHRVIRSDGTLGRYGDDPAWKPRLLEHEAIHLRRAS